MRKTLAEIALLVGGEVRGDRNLVIAGVSGIREAKEGDITFLANRKYVSLVSQTKASALVAREGWVEKNDIALVLVENPDLAFAKIALAFGPPQHPPRPGVHEKAYLGENVKLGRNVSIGVFSIVEDEVEIGDGTTIYAGCYVGPATKIGSDCVIYPRVVIRERCIIGNNVAIHSGSVVGADGFGYATIEGVHHKIPQVGTVVIEDDVEIGALVAIDRARFDRTIIKRGTKIDNLVQIGHNVEIGENSVVVGQVGIAGSAKIGKGVILAGQAGIDGHIEIGDYAIVGGKAGVTKNVPAKTMVSGFPARAHEKQQREQALTRKLPQLQKQVKELVEKVERLERRAETTNHQAGG